MSATPHTDKNKEPCLHSKMEKEHRHLPKPGHMSPAETFMRVSSRVSAPKPQNNQSHGLNLDDGIILK